MVTQNNKSKELPVVLQKEMNTYLFLALPMCVLKTHTLVLPWYYENFINIYLSEENDIYHICGQGFQNTGFFDSVFSISKLNLITLYGLDICESIINQIDMLDNYCYIFLDEYYIEASRSYHNRHFHHDSLIYGYDYEKKEFLAIAMNKDNIFSKLRYSFDEVSIAFEEGKKLACSNDKETIIFFKPEAFHAKYKFSFEGFLNELMDYVYSRNREDKIYFTVPNYYGNNNIKYGISIYNKLIEFIRKAEKLGFYDYRRLHFLYEHKMGLRERFKYLINNKFVSEEFQVYIDNFEDIINGFNKCRLLMQKYMNVPDSFKNKSDALKDKIIENLIKYSNDEKRQLEGIVEFLKTQMYDVSQFSHLSEITHLSEKHFQSLSDCGMYKYHTRANFNWGSQRKIIKMIFPHRGRILFNFDNGKTFKYNYLNESDKQIEVAEFNEMLISSLEVDIYSDFIIDFLDMPFKIFEGHNLAKDAILTASSSYMDDKGNVIPEFTPQSAVDSNKYTFWNARADWQPGEFLEVDFQKPTKVNCVRIKERTDVQRIEEYALQYTDNNGDWIEITRHKGGLKGNLQTHIFKTIETDKLRIVFYDCVESYMGYSEPGLNAFEAFYNGN